MKAMTAQRIKNITISPGYRHAAGLIRSLPQTFAGSGVTLYRGRNTVKAYTAEDGGTLVVKRFKRPNPVQRVAYTFFKKSKAERAYLFAAELRKRGFNTPHEAAYIELREGMLLSDSYFVSAECPLPPLTGLLRRDDFCRPAADSLAGLLVRLHEKGVMHGDLNLTNILYEELPGGGYSLWLIDTNRSRFSSGSLTYGECVENLKRLTHDKALLSYVTGRYATLRGWDAAATVKAVAGRVDSFERRRHITGKIKKMIKGLI